MSAKPLLSSPAPPPRKPIPLKDLPEHYAPPPGTPTPLEHYARMFRFPKDVLDVPGSSFNEAVQSGRAVAVSKLQCARCETKERPGVPISYGHCPDCWLGFPAEKKKLIKESFASLVHNPSAITVRQPLYRQCGSPKCLGLNPVGARFCRTCGHVTGYLGDNDQRHERHAQPPFPQRRLPRVYVLGFWIVAFVLGVCVAKGWL